MFTNLQARLRGWIEHYAGTAATTVAGSSAEGARINRASLFLLWAITVFFVVMFIWIAVAEVDNVTRADGRVIPSAKMQVIQNFEGGIVTEILVKQGQGVAAGQRLVALSPVQHDGDMRARQQQVLALEARSARLSALASGQSPRFPKSLTDTSPELVAVETASFLSKKLEQESQVSVLNAQAEQKARELEEARIGLQATKKILELGREERTTVARMVERGLEPRLELVRIDRTIAEQEGRVNTATVAIERLGSAILEITARKDAMVRQFRSDALNELNRTLAELAPLRESTPALMDNV